MASAKATIVAMKLRILEIHYDSAYLREMSQACLPKKRSASQSISPLSRSSADSFARGL